MDVNEWMSYGMNLLAIPSSLSRSYSTFPLCSGDNLKDAVQSDLRMCTKEPSFYLQTAYLGFYFILCSCKA